MTLKIISAEKVEFEGQAQSVTLPGSMGAFTVLDHHASLISTLTQGKISYRDASGHDGELEVPGGLVDVDSNVVSVCIF